jgi:phospholipid/cholesterol/gamma-HCH transport system ATP-binding protein
VIRTENLSKAFDGRQVLLDVTTEVVRGKTTVILGPSGTGKSVFVKLALGLLAPDRGKVWLDGDEITAMTEQQLYQVRRKVGMCFQDGALFNSMSVGENVAFPLRRHSGLPEREVRRLVREKLAKVGLPGSESKMPAELSGGMRKRVGIARAIALDPELVVFDEPTSGLDPVMSDAIDSLIVQMKDSGHTFLVISHDLPSTARIADNVGMLHEARLVAMGEKSEVLRSADPVIRQFLARFEASAPDGAGVR